MKKVKKFLSYTVFWLIQCTWGIIMTLIVAPLTFLVKWGLEKIGPSQQ
jgi:hypothetical protein